MVCLISWYEPLENWAIYDKQFDAIAPANRETESNSSWCANATSQSNAKETEIKGNPHVVPIYAVLGMCLILKGTVYPNQKYTFFLLHKLLLMSLDSFGVSCLVLDFSAFYKI